MTASPTAKRVAQQLGQLARKGVGDLEVTLAALSAPLELRVVVLEEMARIAMAAAAAHADAAKGKGSKS